MKRGERAVIFDPGNGSDEERQSPGHMGLCWLLHLILEGVHDKPSAPLSSKVCSMHEFGMFVT